MPGKSGDLDLTEANYLITYLNERLTREQFLAFAKCARQVIDEHDGEHVREASDADETLPPLPARREQKGEGQS